jgi:hypothetical protein
MKNISVHNCITTESEILDVLFGWEHIPPKLSTIYLTGLWVCDIKINREDRSFTFHVINGAWNGRFKCIDGIYGSVYIEDDVEPVKPAQLLIVNVPFTTGNYNDVMYKCDRLLAGEYDINYEEEE